MRPNLRARIDSITQRDMLKQEPILVSMTLCQDSAVMRWSVPSRVMPALFTRMSTGPRSEVILAIAAWQALKSETSNL